MSYSWGLPGLGQASGGERREAFGVNLENAWSVLQSRVAEISINVSSLEKLPRVQAMLRKELDEDMAKRVANRPNPESRSYVQNLMSNQIPTSDNLVTKVVPDPRPDAVLDVATARANLDRVWQSSQEVV